MKRFFASVLLIIAGAVSLYANEVKLSTYATPNDGLNDSLGFQSAVSALEALGGGTLIVDAGTWDISSEVDFRTYGNVNNSFIVRGTKGAVIKPNTPAAYMFRFGNQNQVVLENLIFLGDGTTAEDYGVGIQVNHVHQFRIRGCQFIGLRGNTLTFTTSDVVISDTQFLGMSADATIVSSDPRGFTLKDSEFIDYGHFNNNYYSKTPLGNNTWIRLTGTNPAVDAYSERVVVLDNVKFDEGASKHVELNNIQMLTARGITANVAGVTGGVSLYLNNVRQAQVAMSKFGYTSAARAAIRAIGTTKVQVEGIYVTGGVYAASQDASGKFAFNSHFCSSCAAVTE